MRGNARFGAVLGMLVCLVATVPAVARAADPASTSDLQRAMPTADGAYVTPGTDRAVIARLKREFPASSGTLSVPPPTGGTRHSCCFGAPAPLFLGSMTANSASAGGSGCLFTLASDTPEAYRGNTRYITYGLSMDCTPSWISGTGQARLMGVNADPLNPFGTHLGWAPQFNFRGPNLNSGFAGYNRTSDTQLEFIAGWFNAYTDGTSSADGFTTMAGSGAMECDPTGKPVMRCWFYTRPFPFVPDVMTECRDGIVCQTANDALNTARSIVETLLAAPLHDVSNATGNEPREQAGETTIAAYELIGHLIDDLESTLLANIPEAVLAQYQAALDKLVISVNPGGVPRPDDTAQENGEPLATAAASREFYRQAASWGRQYWDRNRARADLPAQFRPVGTGGSGGTDCTRFLSDAWHLGGGLLMDSQRKSALTSRDWYSRLQGANVDTGAPWVNVRQFFDYWVVKRKKASTRRVSPTERNPALAVGDVIQIDEGGGLGWSHGYLVEGMTGVDTIVGWSTDRAPGTPWNRFYHQTTAPAQKARIRARLVHYSG